MLATLALLTAHAADKVDWRNYGGNKSFQRYSPLNQINAGNVSKLQIVWHRSFIAAEYKDKFPDLSPSNYLRGTPIMVDGVLYASDGVGLVEAFDAVTGKTKWVQKPFPRTFKEAAGQGLRGVEYWRSGTTERIIAVRGEFLYSLDAKTGEPDPAFGDEGKVFLRWPTSEPIEYQASNGPIIIADVIIVGGTGGSQEGGGSGDLGIHKEAYPENIRGFDVHTGHLLWTFHVVPQPGEPGNETWGKQSWEYVGDMGNWGPMSGDEGLGYVYVPLSAPTIAYYGGHRPGNNLYANSLVVLDAKTGKLVWHFQMVHHDLWDYDTSSPPVLGDITVQGKKVHAVMQASKTGFLYVFDRATGKPVWPIEERPVPQSTVPGEQTSPTQPFPTKPPPFDRQGITENDLIDFTPALHKEALEVASHYVYGPMFTPPSLVSDQPGGKKGSLIVPGVWGAGNWNTGAFDPDTGTYYAISRTVADVYPLSKVTDLKGTIAYTIMDDKPEVYEDFTSEPGPGLPRAPKLPSGLPILRPPYGRITAFDLNQGSILWTGALGDDGLRKKDALKGLDLPPLGSPGRPAPLVTGSLLFVCEASYSVDNAGTIGKVKFRAFNKATGNVVWEQEMPAGATAAPITYMVNGKQYIVLALGAPGYDTGWLAFALKD